MDELVQGGSVIAFGIFMITFGFVCLWYVLKIFPKKRGTNMIMDDIEHLDTKQYEDLKLEYIRRKMAK